MLKSNILLSVFATSVVSVVATILISNTTFGSSFFSLNLFQIMQLVITLFIGVYLSSIVSHRRTKEAKRIEFSIRVIDDTMELIQSATDNLTAILSESLTNDSKKVILQRIRAIHNKLDTLEKIRCMNGNARKLKAGALECSVEIKDRLTEEWGQDKVITADDRESVKRNIGNIITRLDQLKLTLLNE